LTRLFRPAYSLVRGWRPSFARKLAGHFSDARRAEQSSGAIAVPG